MNSQGYTFKVGGAEWTIDYAGEMGSRWQVTSHTNNIALASRLLDKELRSDVLTRNMWNAIVYVLIDKVMQKHTGKWAKYMMPVSHGIGGVMAQMVSNPLLPEVDQPQWWNVLGMMYEVRVENIICQEDRIYGRCNSNHYTIILQNKEAGVVFHPQFVRQTLIHELLHAVHYELGLQSTKWDSEEHVNTLSILLSEVYNTLQVKTTDNAIDTENTQAQEEPVLREALASS